MTQALVQAVARLQGLLEEETAALGSAAPYDLSDITARKNHSLLEFTRLSRSTDPEALTASEKASLAGLKSSIEKNRRTLELHVRASNQISSLISRSIAADESDGTYGAHLGRRRPQRAGEAL